MHRAKDVRDIRWLVDPAVAAGDKVIPANEDGLRRIDYPFPPEIGEGWLEYLTLADGVQLSKATHRFRAKTGNMVLAGDIQYGFQETTFHVATIRGGSYLRKEFFPEAELAIRPGVDFFRYADRFHVKQLIDTASDCEIWSLVVTGTALTKMLGEQLARQLLDGLGLLPAPSVTANPIPLHVSAPLHATLSPSYSGGMKTLFAQSKVLEYLCYLSAFIVSGRPPASQVLRGQQAAHELREELVRLEGKLPTLDQLAARYGISAKSLNDHFTNEYGQSIHSFVAAHRLNEAHAALINSDIPMKVLSARLGYAHVNNFIAAFKKRFGYPPGSLRRTLR